MTDATYHDDARDVEPLAHYTETDDERQRFYDDLYDHADKPTTLPDDFDASADDVDWDDVERVVDEEHAAERADRWFKFAYGYAGYGSRQGHHQGTTVVFKLPGWFASDELGQWEEWWFGCFEVAKQDADGEWTALCLSDIEPMGDRNEDSYFRNPIDEEWFPFSLMEFGFIVTQERSDDHLIFDRGLDSSTVDHDRGRTDDADIVINGRTQHYGREKFEVDSPYEAKDDLGALDFDQYHADYNGDCWVFDVDALWPFIEHMTLSGWSVCVTERIERETTDDALADGPYLPAEAKRE